MARRKIAGLRAIVTGASSGIGRDIAMELARQKARVIVTARREDRLIELADEIKKQGGEVHFVVGDVTDAAHRQTLLETAQEKLDGLDLLVNNAGIGALGPFASADPTRLERIMRVNFLAPAELIRSAMPLLRKSSRDGIRPMIVNVSSVLGHRAVPNKSEYCASKFAMHGFSDALRAELLPKGVDVLLVSPSTTSSEFFDNVIEKDAEFVWDKFGVMTSEAVAKKTVRAIRRGKQEVILSLGGNALVWFDRLFPNSANWFIAKMG